MTAFDLRSEARGDRSDDDHVDYLKSNITSDATGSVNDLVVKFIKEVDETNTLGIGNGSYNDLMKRYLAAV